jgi:phosphoglycolate phosphatase
MPRRGLLIFDLDGTLFRTDTVSIPAVQSALRAAGFAPPPDETIIEFFGRPLQDFRDWAYRTYPGITEQVLDSVDEWELQLVREQGKLYPGVHEALTALRAATEHLAICSNGPGPYVQQVVASHGLAPYFDAVRWPGDGDTGKPGMVAELLARLPGRPAAVIGDRHDDIAAAHENGILAIGSAYGFGGAPEIAGADATAASPQDLPEIVARLFGKLSS